MTTIAPILLATAFAMAIANVAGKAPLWVSVLLLCLVEMLQVWPR